MGVATWTAADASPRLSGERIRGASPRAWHAVKRTVDVALASVLLIAALPLLIVLAVLIRLDSPGPVVFRQQRYGRGLATFEVLKLRTMRHGVAPELHRRYIAQLAAGEGDHHSLKKLARDPRVTRVGSVLRKLSLDELPQLINVIRGEMSLIGPRPALEYELEHYESRHFARFDVRPGVTGLWQVSGRNRLGFREMLDLDVEYVERNGPAQDARILLKTPLAVVRANAA